MHTPYMLPGLLAPWSKGRIQMNMKSLLKIHNCTVAMALWWVLSLLSVHKIKSGPNASWEDCFPPLQRLITCKILVSQGSNLLLSPSKDLWLIS